MVVSFVGLMWGNGIQAGPRPVMGVKIGAVMVCFLVLAQAARIPAR